MAYLFHLLHFQSIFQDHHQGHPIFLVLFILHHQIFQKLFHHHLQVFKFMAFSLLVDKLLFHSLLLNFIFMCFISSYFIFTLLYFLHSLFMPSQIQTLILFKQIKRNHELLNPLMLLYCF